jgi:hypothetical protein
MEEEEEADGMRLTGTTAVAFKQKRGERQRASAEFQFDHRHDAGPPIIPLEATPGSGQLEG